MQNSEEDSSGKSPAVSWVVPLENTSLENPRIGPSSSVPDVTNGPSGRVPGVTESPSGSVPDVTVDRERRSWFDSVHN